MTIRMLATAAAALAALAPAAARAESAISCGGGIVSMGDSKVDLLAKCGRPTLEERRTEEASRFDVEASAGRRVVSPVERWTYDLGRSRFIQVVTLVAGKVAAAERGSYGFAEEAPPPERPRRATCDSSDLSEGMLKLELLARCGPPAASDAWEEELRTVRRLGGEVSGHAVVVPVEVWTYDFGANRLLRFVRIEDGRVTRVETGGHGYAD